MASLCKKHRESMAGTIETYIWYGSLIPYRALSICSCSVGFLRSGRFWFWVSAPSSAAFTNSCHGSGFSSSTRIEQTYNKVIAWSNVPGCPQVANVSKFQPMGLTLLTALEIEASLSLTLRSRARGKALIAMLWI